MTNRFCTKCGHEVVAGKRFCGGCGQAMPAVSVPEQSQPVVMPEPAGPVIVCMNCGATLTPGKRFCKLCGHAVESAAPVAPAAAASSRQDASPVRDASLVDLPPAAPVAAPDLPTPAPAQNEPLPVPQPLPEPHGRLNAKTGLIIGIAAIVLVLVAAGSFWAWHAYSHRNLPSATNTPNGPNPPIVAPPAPSTGATPTTVQPLKPSAGTAGNLGTASPYTQSGSGAATLSHPSPTNASGNSTQGRAAVAPPASIMPPASPSTTMTAAPRSGTLHYQGPPVAHNGEVVFDHLPHARLKFNFDHQAWSLTIKSNPDGTKKVTLISQAPGYQTSCDLGWEIIE